MIGKTPFEILQQHAVRLNSFPCAAKGEVKWPIPLHFECYLQRAPFGPRQADYSPDSYISLSAQSGSVSLGLCRAIPAPSCSFLSIFLSLLLCFRMKEREEKESGRLLPLLKWSMESTLPFVLQSNLCRQSCYKSYQKNLVYLRFSQELEKVAIVFNYLYRFKLESYANQIFI